MKPSLSVIIPAFNEEGNLEAAVDVILSTLNGRSDSYELLIVNDGSTDGTRKIADRLANTNPAIKVVHNDGNKGLGFSLRRGFGLASKKYVTWCAGDNPMLDTSLKEMFDHLGRADLIISYVANPEFRSLGRRFLSRAYVLLLNSLFGLNLKYYNGFTIYKSESVNGLKTTTEGFSFLAEILILLIKSGCSYVEVPTYHRLRSHGQSKAFKFQNFRDVVSSLFSLVGIFYLKQGGKKSSPAKALVP